MKKVGLFFMVLFLLAACSPVKTLHVEVANPASADRMDELVEVAWPTVLEKLAPADKQQIIVLNENKEQVPYQLIYNGESEPQSLLFAVSLTAGQKAVYSIQNGKPETFPIRTFGRSIPERKDDFAWENDRIAFRMYGPALKPENPSNGVDVWLKKTNDLIVNKFYKDDLENKLSYHIDRGLGLDCYKVGHTLGAGGVAPFANDTLWIGGQYSKARLLDTGALRTTFELVYDSVPFNNKTITQKTVITLDAFSQLNKAVVSYDGDFDTFEAAGGFWLHNEIGNIKSKPEEGLIAYGENASDSKVPAGRTYIGVVFPNGMKTAIQHSQHLVGLADYKKGDNFTYYFGAGWSDWGFASDEAWFQYVENYAARLKQPLTVTVVQ